MKTKEELLQSIYGAEYIHADINGWMKYGMYHPNDLGFDNDEVDRYGDMDLWRPKSLQGIESNNGWISINSEKDLPSENGYYWFYTIENPRIVTHNITDGIGETGKIWYPATFSHYQPIVKPNPPIHK